MKKSWLYQAALLAAVGLVFWYFASNTAQNLEARRIASGFAFLRREAGFEIGETSWLAYGAADTYLRALLVGLANTFRVAAIGESHRCSARRYRRVRSFSESAVRTSARPGSKGGSGRARSRAA